MLAAQQFKGLQRVVEGEGSGDGHDKLALRRERDEFGSHAIAEGRARGQLAAYSNDPVGRHPRLRRNGHNAGAIGDQGERDVDRLIRADRVERRVDALGGGIPHSLLETGPVGHGDAPEFTNHVKASLARGANDAGAQLACLLKHADTDSSGCAVHDNRLARLHIRHSQHLGRGGAGEQQVRRLGEVEGGRLRKDILSRYRHGARVAARNAKRQHLVADSAASRRDLGIRAELTDHSRYLIADVQRQLRGVTSAGDVLVVSGVHPGGLHLDRHLPGTGRRGGGLYLAKDIQPAEVHGNPATIHASILSQSAFTRLG